MEGYLATIYITIYFSEKMQAVTRKTRFTGNFFRKDLHKKD